MKMLRKIIYMNCHINNISVLLKKYSRVQIVFRLFIILMFFSSAQAQETITITNEVEMKDALSIEDAMEVLSNSVSICLGDKERTMELRIECLCKNTDSLQYLKSVFDGVMKKHPTWRGNTLSFQMPIGGAEYRLYFFTMGPLEKQFDYLESCKNRKF